MANDLDIEKFIEAVRLRTPLWDKLDPMHRNLDLTNDLWLAIVDEMGGNLTVAELKQKWHNLRDCFRRDVRIAQAGKKKKRWVYYTQMLFLLTPQNINKSVQKNAVRDIIMQDGISFPFKTETPDEVCSTQLDLNDLDSNNSNLSETENISHQNLAASLQNDFSQETSQEKLVNEQEIFSAAGDKSGYCGISPENENLQNCNKGAGESGRHYRHATDNDDYHFAMSIIPHMRQVSLRRKLTMRMRILEIIAQESGYCEKPSFTQS